MAEKQHVPFRDFARDMASVHVRRELRTDWSMAVIYRWPGVVLAWLCARAGIGPIGATALGFFCALAMPAMAYGLPLSVAAWAVALSGLLFHALDCADGTLARATGKSSDLGADLDFFAGMAQWALLYCAIGILADRTFGTGASWTALGAVAVAGRFLARMVRDQVALRVPPSDAKPGTLTALQIPAVFLAGISGLIPLFALTGDWLGWAVAFLLVYGLLDIAEGLMPLAGPAYRKPGEDD